MTQHVFRPGPSEGTVTGPDGHLINVPEGWALLPPGDAALTRRVKAAGEHWVIQEARGRKLFSKGVYAPAETISTIRRELGSERSTEKFTKRREADLRRRERVQTDYVDEFAKAVIDYLDFHIVHRDVAVSLASLVTAHATPVGSGTVARTKRIPIERRAEAAVIAWMRHQTTGYDGMVIPRIKGKRREVRRMLAQRSKDLLRRYREGEHPASDCPLRKAIQASDGP